jgi:hypothetical protein
MNNKHNFLGKKKKAPDKVLFKLIPLTILFVIAIVLFCSTPTKAQTTNSTSANSTQSDQIQSRLQSQLQGIEFGSHSIYVGIWVTHIYNFQYISGTSIFDMYIYFFWTDPNITTANWFLTNGYPINDVAKVLVMSNITGNVKYEIYRITATLNTPPNAKDYPFDQITLNVALEVINPGYQVNLAWLQNQTGVDPSFVNPNWKTTNIALSSSGHSYPLGVVAPSALMSITQERIKPSSAIASLFPPIIFCIVSAVSFLFSLKDPASVGLRLGLNSSMLITTILFVLSISNSIPPSTSISIFGLFTISVIIFLSLNLIVTITGFAHFVKFKDVNWTIRINRWGFVISVIVPVMLFTILFLLRA